MLIQERNHAFFSATLHRIERMIKQARMLHGDSSRVSSDSNAKMRSCRVEKSKPILLEKDPITY